MNRHVFSNLLTLAKRVIIVSKYNMLERCCQYQDYPRSSCLFKCLLSALTHFMCFKLCPLFIWRLCIPRQRKLTSIFLGNIPKSCRPHNCNAQGLARRFLFVSSLCMLPHKSRNDKEIDLCCSSTCRT